MKTWPPVDAAANPALIRLSDSELEEALCEAQRQVNAAEANRADVVAEFLRRSRSTCPDDPAEHHAEEFVADHVAALLTCTKAVANAMLDTAVEAADHPTLMREWRGGWIESRKVTMIANGLRHFDRSISDAIAGQAIEYSLTHTAPQLRVWLDRRLLAADPGLAVVRRRHATGDRKVTLTPLADGMAEVAAYLPGIQARHIYETVNAIATAAGSEDLRSMDQRRADAFVDVVTGRAEPPQVNVNVVVTADTLLESECEPGWVSGVGAIPGDEARALAAGNGADGLWRALLADADTGVLTGISERRYRPSAHLERAVRARDSTCRFPGCRRNALVERSGTDLDHTIPWPDGPTSATNLAVLCRHHHRLKHSPGWQVTSGDDGRLTWVTPGGRTIVTTPWEYIDRPPHPPD